MLKCEHRAVCPAGIGPAVLALALGLSILCAAASASPAFATRPHQFEGAFGERCAGPPCTGGQLLEPDGVAVGESSGDVYIVDKGEASQPASGRVVRFTAEGAFAGELRGTSATGSGTLTSGSSTVSSVLTSTGRFTVGQEVTAPGLAPNTTIAAVGSETLVLSQAASASELAQLTAHQGFETPETIAVDNSCALRKVSDPGLTEEACALEDPSSGDVYVVDQGHRAIDKYSPSGEYLGQIPEGKRVSGLAVDRQGRLWVLRELGVIAEYTNGEQNEFVEQKELKGLGNVESVPLPGGLAVDSAGAFYLVHGPGEAVVGKVAKLAPSGDALTGSLDSAPASAVALDQASDDPVVEEIATVAVFDPEGHLLERLGEEGGSGHLSEGAGIGVNAAAGTLYVADPGTGTVVVFGPAPPAAPIVEDQSFSEVTAESALLEARIAPRSEPGEAPTEYRFEYGICPALGGCAGSGFEASVPVPDGRIDADFAAHDVTQEAGPLQAGAIYHFRILARNAHGEGLGPEETFTTQPSAKALVLADDRGWELVSPPEKQGALIEPIGQAGLVQAAADGLGIAYLAKAPTEPQPQGYSNKVQVLSRRGDAGWSSRDIAIAHTSATGLSLGPGPEYKFFDSGLRGSAVQPFGEFIPQLSEQASESTAYLYDLSGGCGVQCFEPLVTGKPGVANVPEGTQFGEEEACRPRSGSLAERIACGPEFVGATADLRHVVLHASAALASGAGPAGLYEWSAGALAQVNLLPGGAPAPGALIGFRDQSARGAIADEGARIAWELPGAPTQLYLRDMQRGETLQLDEAGACAGCEGGGGEFQLASADGSRVLFTDAHRLTEDASAESAGAGANLYECEIELSGGQLSCGLRDLTPARGGEGAAVQGGVLGASEDGSYVYLVARGVQSEAPNERGQRAVAGLPNLYMRHGSQTTFIATLAGEDAHDWEEVLADQPTRASPNGQWLEFMSQASLTGYDSRDVATGKPVAEVYLYSAAANRLGCVSCIPTGARPRGVEYQRLSVGGGGLVGENDLWFAQALVGANVPGWANIGSESGVRSRYQPRYLSDSGRLFFDTADDLVPQDSNGTQDVYEYEPLSVGSCDEASDTLSERASGCVSLISPGRSALESAFLDASESGDDVFFLTSAQLSPLDGDTARDVYDAHRCTDRLPCIVPPAAAGAPCQGEDSCKAPPTAQGTIFAAPASEAGRSSGNLSRPLAKPHPRTAAEIRSERLARALKACKKLKKKSRSLACRRRARKHFGAARRRKPRPAPARGRGARR